MNKDRGRSEGKVGKSTGGQGKDEMSLSENINTRNLALSNVFLDCTI
jgi:hypothetical protein